MPTLANGCGPKPRALPSVTFSALKPNQGNNDHDSCPSITNSRPVDDFTAEMISVLYLFGSKTSANTMLNKITTPTTIPTVQSSILKIFFINVLLEIGR